MFPPHSRDRCTYILCQVWLNRRQYVVFHSELSWNRWSKLSATAAEVGHLSVDPRDVRVINESSLPQILHYHQPYFPIGFPANFSKNWSSIYGVLTDYLDSLITVQWRCLHSALTITSTLVGCQGSTLSMGFPPLLLIYLSSLKVKG